MGGLSTAVEATASDAAPGSGVKEVRFFYRHCPGSPAVCGSLNLIGVDSTSPYSVTWIFPGCSLADNRFRIVARAEDNCANVSADAGVDVRLEGRGCFRGPGTAGPSPTAAWTSTLSVPDGRGQVVVDGTQAVFPGAGTEAFSAPAGAGAHRFEATLVDGGSRPGTWRFDLSALVVAPGTLRVVAGEAAVAGPSSIAFRLRGRPGERVVFTFETAPAP
ncbi:MAG TPA: hypothetical protein VGB87_08025 [Vicinamibacteria bacterium]